MNKAVFLDRDGTINVDKDYLFRFEDFEYIDGVIDALKMLQLKGFKLIVVTNQSGIARGYYSEEDFLILHKKIEEDLTSKGIKIDGLYYCPHLDDCDCRKPKTTLFRKAAQDFNVDFSKSYAVGDKLRDLAICKEEPVKGFLITDAYEDTSKIRRVDSLLQAALIICEEDK